LHDFVQVFRNTLIFSLARLSQPLASVFLTVAIAHQLLEEGLGAYTFAITYYLTFQVIASIGLRSLLTREVAKAPGTLWQQLTTALVITIPTSFLAMAVAVVMLPIFVSDDLLTRQAILVLLPAILATSVIDILEGLFFGVSRFRFYSLSLTVENITRVAVAWILLRAGHGVVTLTLVFMVGRFAQLLFSGLYLCIVCGPPRLGTDRGRIVSLGRQSLPFLGMMIANSLYWYINVFILQLTWGTQEVGVYSAAFRVVNVLIIAIQCFVAALYPTLSQRFHDTPEEIASMAWHAIKFVVLFTIPLSLTISVLSYDITRFIYPEGFEASASILSILAWLPVPFAIRVIQAYALLASERQRVNLIVNLFGTIILASLAVVIIPSYGALGASIITVATMLSCLGIQMPLAGMFHLPRGTLRATPGIAFASGLIWALAYLPPFTGALRATLAVTAYACALLLFRAFDRRDAEIIRSVFSREIQT